MSTTTTYCPTCGRAIESEAGALCPQCQMSFPSSPSSPSSGAPTVQVSTSPIASELGSWPPAVEPAAPPERPTNKWLDLFWAFLIWGVSGAFLLGLDAL